MTTRTALLLTALLAAPAHADVEIKPLVVFAHVSDPSDSGASDLTSDFLGAGGVIRFGKRKAFSVELAAGRKAINCRLRDHCKSTLGGYAAIKWSPGS